MPDKTSVKRAGRVHGIQVRRKPGAAPGTLVVNSRWPRPRIQVFAYGPDGYEEREIESPDKLEDVLTRWPVTWINVNGLGDAATIETLGAFFGVHRLALEDVVNVDQRAKVEEHEEHLFIVGRMASLPDPAVTEQLSLFCGSHFVLTFQERAGDCFEGVRARLRAGKGRIRKAGPDYLTYALLDSLIDSYFPVVEHVGGQLEALEDEVLTRPAKTTMAAIQEINTALTALRRAVLPHREMLHALLRGEHELVHEETLVYLRDCHDHAFQITDLVESYREICSDLINVYMSSISNRMNEVMKLLTVIATIFIPLSFVAGLYGMNFNPERSPWNMPELNWYLGYPFALLIMLVVAIGFLVYFRRRGWL